MSARLLWPELEPEDDAGGWLADIPQVTSAQVLGALAARHPMDGWNEMPGRWVFVREVLATTGAWGEQQRFDAVAIGLVPSNGYARVVYEIKVSRADWLRELRPRVDRIQRGQWEDDGSEYGTWRSEIERRERPGNKWDAALAVSTEFWVAAPPHCVLLSELPPEAGLVEVRPWGPSRELRARVVRQAPVRDTPMPDAGFWAAVLRRAAERRA
jgi:hypothetical protein